MKPTRREEAETALHYAEKVLAYLTAQQEGRVADESYHLMVRQAEVVRILRNFARPRTAIAAQ